MSFLQSLAQTIPPVHKPLSFPLLGNTVSTPELQPFFLTLLSLQLKPQGHLIRTDDLIQTGIFQVQSNHLSAVSTATPSPSKQKTGQTLLD